MLLFLWMYQIRFLFYITFLKEKNISYGGNKNLYHLARKSKSVIGSLSMGELAVLCLSYTLPSFIADMALNPDSKV